MSVELLHSGSLYDWFARQFWRLRYAGSHLLVRYRVIQELDYVKKCLDVDKVPKPKIRATAGDTHKARAEEHLYEYTREICGRLETCVQAAFAEFDSYSAQLGFSLRVTSPEEEEAQIPAINSGLILADLPKYPNSNPAPVTIADNDLK
eukprot:14046337-Heterocapsa_arctica.AAC.1